MIKFQVPNSTFKNLMSTCFRGLSKYPNARAIMELKGTEDSPRLRVATQTGSSYFDGEIDISSVENFEHRVWGLEHDKIRSTLSVLPTEDTMLRFEAPDEGGQTLKLNYLSNKINIKFYQDVQMPELTGEIKVLGNIQSSDFVDMLNNMLKVVVNDSSSVGLATGCLHLTLDNDKMTTTATNMYAIAKQDLSYDSIEEEVDDRVKMIKLEQGTLLASNKVLHPNEIWRLISVGDNLFGYIDGHNIINLVTLADIRPIDFSPILNSMSNDNYIFLSANSLKESFSNIGKLNPTEEGVTLRMDRESASVNTQLDSLEISLGEVKEDDEDDTELPDITNINEEVALEFYRPATTDVFGLLKDENVRLGWESDGKIVQLSIATNKLRVDDNLTIGVMFNG